MSVGHVILFRDGEEIVHAELTTPAYCLVVDLVKLILNECSECSRS